MEGWRVAGRRAEVGRDTGGWRRVLGGRAEVEKEEEGFRRGCVMVGRGRNDDDDKGGGGIRVLALAVAVLVFRVTLGAGRAGGGIDKPVCRSGSRGGGGSNCDPNCSVFGGIFFGSTLCEIPPALPSPSSDVRAKDGSEERP